MATAEITLSASRDLSFNQPVPQPAQCAPGEGGLSIEDLAKDSRRSAGS
jgi:hypothetical protein